MRTIKPKIECLFVALIALMLAASMALAATAGRVKLDAPSSYKIVQDGIFNVIQMEDFAMTDSPGDPMLPHKIQDIVLPPDALMSTVKVNIVSTQKRTLDGTYDIKPAGPDVAQIGGQLVEVWGGKNIVDGKNADVYQRDSDFPASPVKLITCSQMRKWQFVRVDFSPFQYNPVSKKLTVTESMEIEISYEKAPVVLDTTLINDKVQDDIAAERFLNYSEAKDWYVPAMPPDQPSQTHDYVIITTNAINAGSTKLASFVTHKQSLGFSVLVVTYETSIAGLTGQTPNHRAEKIREWLKTNYATMGIEYVLLIGDPSPYESGEGDIPMKMCWPRRGAGSDEESPTDYFYADLTGNWDFDSDQYYGEWTDDFGPVGGVDFTSEVYVGRIPVYSTDYTSLDNILQKTIDYENELASTTGWRSSIVLPMGYQDAGYDGAQLAEQMKDDYLDPTGYSSHRMYQQGNGPCGDNSGYASEEELRGSPGPYPAGQDTLENEWTNDAVYGIVCWWAHGSSTSASVGYSGCWDGTQFQSAYCASLDDDHPAFTYQCSCTNGYPETSNNLQYSILEQGGVATVSATRVSWFNSGVTYGNFDGSTTNSGIGYEYVDRLVQNLRAGNSLYNAKGSMSPESNTRLMNWYDFNLYGDPAVSIDANSSGTGSVVKWEQPPDETYNGIDIRCDRSDGINRILADDFNCTRTGPITNVTIWGSWRSDDKGQIQKIHLSIHSDDPVGLGGSDPENEYSKPDVLLWARDFTAADFVETPYSNLEPEWFWDPTAGSPPPLQGEHTGIWQYDISIDDSNQFVQQGDPCNPIVYWLDIWVELDPDIPNTEFGWKTSSLHWNDDAVFWEETLMDWQELRYPPSHPFAPDSIDLSFKIITGEEGEPNNIKWEQLPDLTPTGIDIRLDRNDGIPRIMADDFLCTTTGLITDVHFWGSWKNDERANITDIHLSIHSDDPVGPGGSDPENEYSMPDLLLWEKDFSPGDFNETLVYTLPAPEFEWWWDIQNGVLEPDGDTQVWRYDIYIDPCDAFRQQGDPCQPIVYWLDIYVKTDGGTGPQDPGKFGWKTSRQHWNDDAVYADTDVPPFPWQELRYPPGHPYYPNSIDMAFAITTDVNEPNIPEPKPAVPHLKWSQPPVEIDPLSTDPLYCGWDEPSHREIISFVCWGPTWPYQCHGDADNMAAGPFRISTADLNILKLALGSSYPEPNYNPCADFDRNFTVDHEDVNILKEWINKLVVPADCPAWTAGLPATGGIEYWDLFAVSLSPTEVYWNLVNGGAGTLSDPVVSPDPAGASVIDLNTPLGGVAWGFGGATWADGILEADASPYSIELMGEPNYYLSVVLDTSTTPQYDTGFPSWGGINNIVVYPWDSNIGDWGPAINVNNWVISPFDPDGGTVVTGGLSSSVTLASNDFGALEYGSQGGIGIWGASAQLPPDPCGYRVTFDTDVYTWDAYTSAGPQVPQISWKIVADDFRCLGSMPVTSVHWWGSYIGWEGPNAPPIEPEAWRITFWSNVPAGINATYSYPEKLLWQVEIPAERVDVNVVGTDYFPSIPFSDTCFQYNIELMRDEIFWQNEFIDETTDNTFWISIAAVYPLGGPPVDYPWGWKTRPWSWMDDAVTIDAHTEPNESTVLDPTYVTPLEYEGESYDVCFELDTDPNWIKWEQAYDSIRHWQHYEDELSMATGAEPVMSRLVADDWPCDSNGGVSAIVWWGSYIGYRYEACRWDSLMSLPVPPDYFLLNIWTDVPIGDPINQYPYSHPGNMIWEYKAYNYDEVLVGYDKHPHIAGQPEYDPNEPVFRYSVKIPDGQHFQQDTNDGVYWLSVVAVYDTNDPTYPWGWTNHEHMYNDDAVAGTLATGDEWTWEELYDQTGLNSVDMSFVLFTECMLPSHPRYADWSNWGKHHCWCYKRNCRGDADGKKLGVFWVAAADLDLLKSAYLKVPAVLQTIPNGICADFDHLPLGVFRVAASDLNTLKAYYLKIEPLVPPCPMDWDGDTDDDYNFWTN